METNRRQFIGKLLGSFATAGIFSNGVFPLAAIADPSSDNPARFIAARKNIAGQFSAAVLDAQGNLIFSEDLNGRGHATAISPDKKLAVVFARRPGRFALVLDLINRNKRTAITPPDGHHFFGHGFFSNDGRLLYASENDYENERGIIGIYDITANFMRVSEIETHGIGPHEALLMSDGSTIAVANGGILTHPDYPRQKLNLSTMEPSISYLDARNGKLISQASLPREFYQLSLRHMTEAKGGTIWIGGQYEGSPTDQLNLVACHQRGKPLTLVSSPKIYDGMKHYIGSVAANASGTLVATSAPRGNTIAIWNNDSGELVRKIQRQDAGGVAGFGEDFAISDGLGNLSVTEKTIHQNTDFAWDNHLTSL
ncbi:DUF1513 domain-containing protein [Kiloniella antarctica]|uniref:DUF1513 domain-containing protein n=1 Tax=Kiloniella antarctica TaxID=1550907 RepID=A0ABW5BLL2_9PROT